MKKWKKRRSKYAIGVESGDRELVNALVKAVYEAGMAQARGIAATKQQNRRAALGFFAARYRLRKRGELLSFEILKRLEGCTNSSGDASSASACTPSTEVQDTEVSEEGTYRTDGSSEWDSPQKEEK